MACLKEQKNSAEPCRVFSKVYLECRMSKCACICCTIVSGTVHPHARSLRNKSAAVRAKWVPPR